MEARRFGRLMEAAASSYQAAEPRAGSAPKAWAYFDPESEPVDPSTQLIWPATRALVGDYLPPELRHSLDDGVFERFLL